MPLQISPTVSVILPSFNRLTLLGNAIASVVAQTFTDWELLVADDGSGAETRAYLDSLRDPRIKVLGLGHSGNPAAVRNAAIATARGEYLAFLDSDDAWLPAKLEVQLAALRARPACRWSYTDTERINGSGHPIANGGTFVPLEDGILEACLNNEAYIAMPTVMAQRTLVDEVGAFDEELPFAEDYDLWVRLGARSKALPLVQPLTRVCVHDDNYCHDRIGFYRGWLTFYDKLLTRLGDPTTAALCRRRRAEIVVHLANRQADRRRALDVARTMIQFRSCARDDPKWRRGTTKALVRSLTPRSVLSLYRWVTLRRPSASRPR